LIFFRAPPDIRNIAVALNFYNKIFQLNALNFYISLRMQLCS